MTARENGKVRHATARMAEDYWMGRYYGFIEAPNRKMQRWSPLVRRKGPRRGAAPY